MKGCRALEDSEIRLISNQLRGKSYGLRNLSLFLLGLHTGFRITELLSIRIKDIWQADQLCEELTVRKRSRKGKRESMTQYIASPVRETLRLWLLELRGLGYMTADDYVFQAETAGNHRISRSYAWDLLHDAARSAGLTGIIGTHSMRKTFAHRFYSHCLEKHEQGEAIDPLVETQQALGHKDILNTIKYLDLKSKNTKRFIKEIFES